MLRRVALTLSVALTAWVKSAPLPAWPVPTDEITPRIHWVGASPPTAFKVDCLDEAHRTIRTFDVQSAEVDRRWAVPAGTRYVRVVAPHFSPLEVRRERLAFGLSMDAVARVALPAGADRQPSRLTAFARRRGGPETLRLTATGLNSSTLEIPWGDWLLLVDNGLDAPAVITNIQLAPGEERRMSRIDYPRSRVTRFRVVTADGNPAAGAHISWNGGVKSDEAALLAKWFEGRSWLTDKSGHATVDRLAPYPHAWRVEIDGMRPTEVRPARTSIDQPAIDVVLQALPTLHITVGEKSAAKRDINVVVQRISENPDRATVSLASGPSVVRTIWQNVMEPGGEADVQLHDGGLYRAIASLAGSVAVHDLRIALADGVLQYHVNLSFSGRRVFGKVSLGGKPAEGARVTLFPRDRVITPQTVRLAEMLVGGDGEFELKPSYTGGMYLTAELPDGTTRRETVDAGEGSDAEVNIDLHRASLAIVVSDSHTGTPLEAAQVLFEFSPLGQGGGGVVARLTDEQGRVLVRDLQEGSMAVRISAQGYAPTRLHDVVVQDDVNPELAVGLERETAFRIRINDTGSNPVEGAEILRLQAPLVWNPRRAPLEFVGRTDGAGECVLDELFGEPTLIYVVRRGYSVQTGMLPSWGIPGQGPEQNTLELILWPYVSGAGLRVLGKSGETRSDALLLFTKAGVDVPISVLVRATEENGLAVPDVLLSDRQGLVHAGDLLAPGLYQVSALYPGIPGSSRIQDDRRDVIGAVQLPLTSEAILRWGESRPSFLQN